MIDTTGLQPAELLAALYNAAQTNDVRTMSVEDARVQLQQPHSPYGTSYIGQLGGRWLAIYANELGTSMFNPCAYDLFNGRGLAREVVRGMRQRKKAAATVVARAS